MNIKYTRILRKGSSGSDVRYMKDCLFALKYYKPNVKRITHATYGSDTETAVRLFQSKNIDTRGKKLKVDGIIGTLSWHSIVKEMNKNLAPVLITEAAFPNLTEKTVAALDKAWQGLSAKRIDFMKLCLIHAYDMVNRPYVPGTRATALYVYNTNLYDRNKKLYIPDAAKIKEHAKRYPAFFNGGREQFMLNELAYNPSLASADCSGMIVGVARKLDMVTNTFDTTANSLASSRYSVRIAKSALKPGDWAWRSGHIGVYVGADLVVEFAGGAYGAQLTSLSNRQLRNLMSGTLDNAGQWQAFVDPIWY